LNLIEHVSLARSLLGSEISRPAFAQTLANACCWFQQLTRVKRWFWSRKPDAGFVLLRDYPATLLQALVFDEWVEARNEKIDVVIGSIDSKTCPEVHDHYRKLGLLQIHNFQFTTP
jgi:hypothetical protein